MVSISIGVAVYPEHGLEIKDLIEKADMAMYNAKHSGRNQCKIDDVEMKAC